MSPTLATLACFILILVGFRLESRQGYTLSRTLWIPFIWILILNSRPLSFWFASGPAAASGDALEGNAFDRNIYLALTIAAGFVLSHRSIDWRRLLINNAALLLLYAYLLLSISWSAEPTVSFKRWFKELCAFPILLIILSEPDPLRAIQTVFTRNAIALFLLSVLCIKYIPDLGRVYSRSGGLQIIGITEQKNALGELVLVSGMILAWRIKTSLDDFSPPRFSWRANRLSLFLLAIGFWLLLQSDSKTSLICLLCGMAILWSDRLPFFRQQPALLLWIGAGVVVPMYFLKEYTDLFSSLLVFLGRDATLTGRTDIWDVVGLNPVNPLIGCGYLLYWDQLGEFTINGMPARLKTAHNGYIDIFLDGGAIALMLLMIALAFSLRHVARDYLARTTTGCLRLSLFVIIILANCSESFFVRKGPLWFLFLLCCLDYSQVFTPKQP